MTTAWQIDKRDSLGSRLRILRLEFGLSANAAAAAVGGMTNQTWTNYETGNTAKPDANKLWAIVRRFEGRPDKRSLLFSWLMDGGPQPERPEPEFPFTSSRRSASTANHDAGQGDIDQYRVTLTPVDAENPLNYKASEVSDEYPVPICDIPSGLVVSSGDKALAAA